MLPISRPILEVLKKPVVAPDVTKVRCSRKGCSSYFDPRAAVEQDGPMTVQSPFCDDCRSSDFARLTCLPCARVLAMVKPHRDPKTGFVFASRRHYHVRGCPRCVPDIREAVIVEIAEHLNVPVSPTRSPLP